jgi:hypothetical protein
MSATLSPYHRYSDWVESRTFSLNVADGTYENSVDFMTEKISIIPMICQFAPSGTDPSGSRHLQTHSSFVRVIASGEGAATINLYPLDYGGINIGPGSGIGGTKCIIFRIDSFECDTSRVLNMRFWHKDYSDFLYPQYAKVLYEISNDWTQNKAITIADFTDKTKWVPESLPEIQNLFRASGNGLSIYGTNDDQVSQYIYLALASSGTTPLGEYGNISSAASGFNFCITYDYDNIVPLRD